MLAYTSNQPAPVYPTPAGGVETLTRDLIAPGINAEPTRLSAAYRLAALPDAEAAVGALAAALVNDRENVRRKRSFCTHLFYATNDHFTRAGSGRTYLVG